jgi:uncharacterized membrane protein YgcG
MKRTLTAVLALTLLLTGCGSKKKNDPTAATEPTTEVLAVVTEATTAPPRPIAERAASLQAAGDTYIFDELNVLSDEEKKQYNDYLGWLCSSRQIRAAAVLTGELDGISPEQFARNYYETLYDAHEPGFLVLINNDTDRDCIYRAGSCAERLPDPAAVIAQATPFLVEQQYADALEILLPIGENLSERIFDRCGALTAEEQKSLEALAAASDKKVCVLLVNALPGEEPPETTEAPAEPESTDAELSAEAETPPAPDDALTTPEDTLSTPEDTQAPPEETEAAPAEVSDAMRSYAEAVRKETEADTLLIIHTADKTAWITGGDDALLTNVRAALDSGDVYTAACTVFSE